MAAIPVTGTCVTVNNLPFCNEVNYLVDLPFTAVADGNSSDLARATALSLDQQAEGYYSLLTSTILARYNCNEFRYSFVRNCDQCQAAYRIWVCANLLPRCREDPTTGAALNERLLPCTFVCEQVQQSCPTVLQFMCPVGNLTALQYATPSSPGIPACHQLNLTYGEGGNTVGESNRLEFSLYFLFILIIHVLL